MTYTVSSGTLNSTIPYHTMLKDQVASVSKLTVSVNFAEEYK